LEYRTLGAGPTVSVVGLGCWAIGGHGYGKVEDRASITAIERALELGITLFDTADVYGFGHSEQILGKALGDSRRDVIVATKGGVSWDSQGRTKKDASAKYLRRAVEGSLSRLGLECISLYQLHWKDEVTPLGVSLDTLGELRREGKIEHIGVSNMALSDLESIRGHDLVSNQIEYNYLQRDNEEQISDQFSRFGVNTLVYGGLARGLLTGKYTDRSVFEKDDTRGVDPLFNKGYETNKDKLWKFGAVAEDVGCSQSELALAWATRCPEVSSVLAGAKSAEQVSANVKFLSNPSVAQALAELLAG
jgi:aryl-alcohol dehydrogenase-like predicted oxidoreductase